jgi:thiol-disulfide isomerase/thioredoxin
MKHRNLTLALALLAGAPLSGQEAAPAKPTPVAPATEPQAPAAPATLTLGAALPADTKLADLDGKEFAFADLQGKNVVVHFWSTTCPSEKVAEPKLNKLAEDWKGKDVVVLAVNANQNEIGAKPDAAAFAEADAAKRPYASLRKKSTAVGMNHTVLVDHGAAFARLLEAKTTPHCFVFDSKGVLQYTGALDNDASGKLGDQADAHVRNAVEALLAGKPVATPTTKPYG